MEHTGRDLLNNELNNARALHSNVFRKALDRVSLLENAMLGVAPGERTNKFFKNIHAWILQAEKAAQNSEKALLNAITHVKEETRHFSTKFLADSESQDYEMFTLIKHMNDEQREAFIKSEGAYGRAILELAECVAHWLAAHGERLEQLIMPLISALKDWLLVLADQIERFAFDFHENVKHAPRPMSDACNESSDLSDPVTFDPLSVPNYLLSSASSQWEKCTQKCLDTVRRYLMGFFEQWRDEVLTLESNQEYVSSYLDDWRNKMENTRDKIGLSFVDSVENDFKLGGLSGALNTMEDILRSTKNSFSELSDLHRL